MSGPLGHPALTTTFLGHTSATGRALNGLYPYTSRFYGHDSPGLCNHLSYLGLMASVRPQALRQLFRHGRRYFTDHRQAILLATIGHRAHISGGGATLGTPFNQQLITPGLNKDGERCQAIRIHELTRVVIDQLFTREL